MPDGPDEGFPRPGGDAYCAGDHERCRRIPNASLGRCVRRPWRAGGELVHPASHGVAAAAGCGAGRAGSAGDRHGGRRWRVEAS